MTPLGFQPTEPHPVLQLPTAEQALALGFEGWQKALTAREQAIRDEVAWPLWKAWEPPIWKVCDALWGAPWLDAAEAEAIRLNLNFRKPVNVLLILGGWGTGKTEYAGSRLSRIMQTTPHAICWALHETVPSAVDQQHPLIYKYLPPNLKGEKAILEKTTYVAYKEKTGFSDGSFVLPNHARCRFWTYEGGVDKLQGPTVRFAWGDELEPVDFLASISGRVGRGNGTHLMTFAPIHGHTATVQEMCDGAEVCREITAFLNPTDGGPKDVARYLGLGDEEFARLRAFFERREKPPFPNVPWSRPEECAKWLTGESGQMPVPAGRTFKTLPRVLKSADPEEARAVVLFNGADNPYGKPLSVYGVNSSVSEETANRIFYGATRESRARMFPLFDEHVHVMPDEAIPGEGTNYLWVDPAGRNFFMGWFRFLGRAIYLYREWPGSYDIPGQGVPGPWALPDGKLGDGKRGPAQESFGFGLLDYKRELARLEGWKDFAAQPERPDGMEKEDWLKPMRDAHGSRESVLRRFIDSRFASTKHMENDRPVTMLENFTKIGLTFDTTPGDDVTEGVQGINDWLNYEKARPVDALNCPRLHIAKSCKNTIFALKTWKNEQGLRGATKDPIDILRYASLQGVGYVAPGAYESEGGGSY